MTWRSPERLFQQAEPLRPLLLCFAGPQAAANAPADMAQSRSLLQQRGVNGSSNGGGNDSYPTTVEVSMPLSGLLFKRLHAPVTGVLCCAAVVMP